MNRALRYIFLISIISFILLETGFYLEGFLQYILFSIVAIIFFVMMFFFYGYTKETKKNTNKLLVFAALMILPLVSIVFNPTLYFRKIDNKEIVLLAWQHPDKILKNESSSSIILLKNGRYQLKEYGFWMNSVEMGNYHFEGRILFLEEGSNIRTFKLKRYYQVMKLYALKGKKLDWHNNYLIETMDKPFIHELRKKPV